MRVMCSVMYILYVCVHRGPQRIAIAIALRFGMRWHGMAWHGMGWYGMAKGGMGWHGVAWHTIVLSVCSVLVTLSLTNTYHTFQQC
jgi:hypothetical protein